MKVNRRLAGHQKNTIAVAAHPGAASTELTRSIPTLLKPMFALAKYGLLDRVGEDNMFGNIDDALDRAREIVGEKPVSRPSNAIAEVARERPESR